MSLIRKHGAVLQAWACLALVTEGHHSLLYSLSYSKDVLLSVRLSVTLCRPIKTTQAGVTKSSP